MQNHFKYMTRSFLGVYRPHPAKALLPQDITTSYVRGCRQVRISPVAAGHTSELQTNTVPLSNMTAPRIFLRRVSRINGRGTDAFLGKLMTFIIRVLSYLYNYRKGRSGIVSSGITLSERFGNSRTRFLPAHEGRGFRS